MPRCSLLCLCLVLSSCERDDAPPPFVDTTFYEALQAEAFAFAYRDGQWLEDYGDAAYYGPAFYAWSGVMTGDASSLARAAESFAQVMTVVDQANLLSGDVNEIVMSALGALEYMAATGDRTRLPEVDGLIDDLDGAVEVLDWYLSPAPCPGTPWRRTAPPR